LLPLKYKEEKTPEISEKVVTPAKAGVQDIGLFWIPACAGMTNQDLCRPSS
jgi:hypothetical protein